MWGLFCDGGGGSSGSVSGDNGGGTYYNITYNSYVNGYNGYNVGGGATWSAYAGPSEGNGNPCGGTGGTSAAKGVKTLVAAPGCGGLQVTVTAAQVVNAVCVQYGLTTTQQVWLNQNLGFFYGLDDYINNSEMSEEDKADFLSNSVNYFIDNPSVGISGFITQFSTPTTFDIDDSYTPEAANYYKLDNNTRTLYPRFTKLVDQLPAYLNANPSVLTAIMYYTGYTKAQILQMVAPGNGPEIVVKELPGLLGHYTQYDNYNDPITPKPNYVEISASFVRGLESANLTSTQQATAFLLAVTIFHETVHLGRNMKDLHDGSYEYGLGFENLAYKVIVTADNAAGIRNYTFILN